MCCTFGDLTDVQWWRELQLPVRTVIGRDGRLLRDTPEWLDRAPTLYAELAGKTIFSARELIVAKLRETGDLDGEPKPTAADGELLREGRQAARDRLHPAVVHPQRRPRRGPARRRSSSAATSSTWVPGAHAAPLHELGRGPERRLADLAASGSSACRSRSGTRSTPTASRDYDHPLLPREDDLPIDPTSQAPAGYDESQRGKPGGFMADPDVMDTWATSSLTPQIVCGWERDPDLFARTFPMDLNTHAHEIIRTWLFSRVVRAHFENGTLPWARSMISGFVVDPDRKKMQQVQGQRGRARPRSSSKFGSDAVRWRAAMARPGLDSPFDETQMKVGRRLAIKVLNATKFVLGFGRHRGGRRPRSPSRSTWRCCTRLRAVVDEATAAFDAYDYTGALEVAERFFWTFCDDYLELVKERAYGGHGEAGATSAQGRAGRRPVGAAAAARAVPAVRRPRRSGRGGRRARSTGRRWPTAGRRPGRRPQTTRRCWTRSPRCWRASVAPSRRPRSR